MGWERKRGKLEEFNRLLRGATDTSFTVQVGDLAILPGVRYCLTLDSDTRLPRDAAQEADRHHRPSAEPRRTSTPRAGRVTEGYGILQPRVSVTMASAAGSLFARLYAGHTGVDPYTTAVSDIYQDLFGEGIFTGKGLYDVDAFTAALDGRVPENALLSHDLFEGLYARTALVTDVEVVDDYPVERPRPRAAPAPLGARRLADPALAASPSCPPRRACSATACRSSRAGRSSTTCGAAWCRPPPSLLLLAAWTVLPGSPLAWTAARPGRARLPRLSAAAADASPARPLHQPWRVFLRAAWEDLRTAVAQVALQVTFLANQACETAHAIALTLVRLDRDPAPAAGVGDGRRQRRAGGGRGAPARGCSWREMIASPVIALLGFVLVAAAAAGRAAWPRCPILAPVGRRAVHRLRAQPPVRRRAAPCSTTRTASSCRRRAPDVALLRDLHRRRGPRPAAGQLPGGPRAAGRAPHVADQHRHGPAGHAGRARPRLHRDRRAGGQGRRHADDDGGPRALRGPPAQLVRHAHAGAAAARLRLHRRQRQPRRRPDGPRRRAARGGPRRPRAAARRRSRTA